MPQDLIVPQLWYILNKNLGPHVPLTGFLYLDKALILGVRHALVDHQLVVWVNFNIHNHLNNLSVGTTVKKSGSSLTNVLFSQLSKKRSRMNGSTNSISSFNNIVNAKHC
jgi:hypothetical protein